MNSQSELRERRSSEYFAFGQRRCIAHSGGSCEHHRSTTAASGSKDKKGASYEEKSVFEPSGGEGAFSDDTVDASQVGITPGHATRVFPIGIVGAGAGSISPERVRRYADRDQPRTGA